MEIVEIAMICLKITDRSIEISFKEVAGRRKNEKSEADDVSPNYGTVLGIYQNKLDTMNTGLTEGCLLQTITQEGQVISREKLARAKRVR
ncbi:hypothetical protein RYX36_022586 [Vicia faba]